MIHIPETLTLRTEDLFALLISAFFIGVAIVCFVWIWHNEKEPEE